LTLLGGILIAFDRVLPSAVASGFEMVGGVVLIGLGADVIRRLRKQRVHFHVHQHSDGVRHFHAHSHPGETHSETHAPTPHELHPHDHGHSTQLFRRAWLIGGVHGLAGSGAILLLAVQKVESAAAALAYLAVFGLGSILGMVLFSLVVSLPVRLSSRRLNWASGGLTAALGVTSMAIGIWILVEAASTSGIIAPGSLPSTVH
jgi:ABC-type nickel/cobalt efflux system permease component RcnA